MRNTYGREKVGPTMPENMLSTTPDLTRILVTLVETGKGGDKKEECG
jgi:hypothetical protein